MFGRARVDVAIGVVAVTADERSSRRDRIGAREPNRSATPEPIAVVVRVEQPKLAGIRRRRIVRSVDRVRGRDVDDIGRAVSLALVGCLHIVRASIELDAIGLWRGG